MSLKDSWKQVGKDFMDIGDGDVKDMGKGIGKMFKHFGKSMVKTVKYSADKVSEWAETDDHEDKGPQGGENTEK